MTYRAPYRAVEVAWLHIASKALAVAVELDLFTAVGEGATLAEIGRRAKVSERGARALLDALCPFGLIRKQGARYLLSEEARTTLLPGASGYVGDSVLAVDAQRPAWEALREVARSGRPAQRVDDEAEARKFFPAVAARLYRANLAAAEHAAKKLEELKCRPKLALDLAAGSGVWGIALARRFPELLVTAADFPEVLPIAREHAGRAGVADRFAYLAGSLRDIDLGREGYDVVILGHILHSEGEVLSKELLARVHRALRPGGYCLIAEVVPDPGRRERVFALLFALNMLLRTGEGDVFTLPEMQAWLRHSGFVRSIAFDGGTHSPLVLARKGSGRAKRPRG